jgi:hypothetical protein
MASTKLNQNQASLVATTINATEKNFKTEVTENNNSDKTSQWTFKTDVGQWVKTPNLYQNSIKQKFFKSQFKPNSLSTESNLISNLDFLKSLSQSLSETKETNSTYASSLSYNESNLNKFSNLHIPESNMNDLKQALKKFNESKSSITGFINL